MSRLLLLWFLVPLVASVPVNELYPFGDQDDKVPPSDDASSQEIQLSVPIVFYETTYRSIFVNTNGILSFLTEVPSFFNSPFPLTYPIIAPLYTDVDTRGTGTVYYRETRESDLLQKATAKIHRHFSKWQNFAAQSLFVVTWADVGHYDSNTLTKNTFQVVIVSDGTNSFVLFHYRDNGIQWIQGNGKIENMPDARAQAGFMSGDGRMFILPGSGTDQIQRYDRMSNINDPGVWLFRIGNVGVEGNVMEPDLKLDKPLGKTCPDNPLPCPPSAECVQYPTGLCCHCMANYYGNGRECIPQDLKAQRLVGKVSGYLNNSELENMDLHAYVDLRDGKAFTALSRVPPNIGHRMQALVPIGNLVGWLFAKPQPGLQNGFSLTGATFNRSAEIEFPQSGDHVFIQENYMGTDVFRNVKLTLEIRGSLPEIHLGSRVELADFKDVYTREAKSTFRSHAERVLKVDAGRREIPFIIDQTIMFDECSALPMDKVLSQFRLQVSRNFITYDRGQEIVRFAGLFGIEPPPVDDPCTKQRIDCGEHSTCIANGESYKCVCQRGYQMASIVTQSGKVDRCVDIDECANRVHNCHPDAICTNIDGRYLCECKPGFSGDGTRCESERTCADLRCNENAVCIEDIPGRPMCRCRDGFQGDGYTCKSSTGASTEDDCRHGARCDPNAECLQTSGGSYRCYCKAGYSGTGLYCIEDIDSCEKANNCGQNAECILNEETRSYYCACKPGYRGDGVNCKVEGTMQDCRIAKNCHPYAECVMDDRRGTSACVCFPGFEGDGYTCKQVDSEINCHEADVCSPEADCIDDPLTKKGQCRCRPDFDGNGLVCRPLDECTKHGDCNENSHCTFDRNANRYKCACNPGYQLIDQKCIADSDAVCNFVNNCHQEATCKFDILTRQYKCECKQGWKGDGLTCELAVQTCNVVNNCHPQADCVFDTYGRSYVCRCAPGYSGDGRVCTPERNCVEDPRQCHANGECVYDEGKRGYVCRCRQGYLGNGVECVLLPRGETDYLIFAQGMSLLKMPVTPSKSNPGKLLLMAQRIPVGLDVDCLEGHLYWTDVTDKTIHRASYNGTMSQKVVKDYQMLSPEGLSVDWVSRNIFWTDSGKDTIQVARLDGLYVKTLIKDNLVDPRGIAVHPGLGKIYWTDWNRASPKIEKANMDGTERSTFISGNLGLPNMLAIDFYNNELCWTDAGLKRVECATLYTSNRKVVYAAAAYPFDITATRSHLFWTDWELKFVYKLDKRGGIAEPLDLPLGGNGKLYGIVTVPEQCPGLTNVCAVNNGGCKYLCLADGRGGRTCHCPDQVDDDECKRE